MLIVDDSAVARAVLARLTVAGDRFVVAGAVPDVPQALAFLAQAPVDAILLDLELPGIDGLTALPDLLAAGGGAKVLVVSSKCAEGAAASVRALALGAADTLVKPGVTGFTARFAETLRERLARLTERRPAATLPPFAPAVSPGAFDVVAIGASTGGIHALSRLLPAIPPSFDRPIVITQHLPASFSPYFAAQVALLAGRPCDVATERMRLRPGRIVVAPGDAHVVGAVARGGSCVLRLSDAPAPGGHLPSVDPMFSSLADIHGPRLLAVVLSGMGRDGLSGASDVRRAGGVVLVQDEASSAVWGMPGAVAGAGLANAVMTPAAIGAWIAAHGATRDTPLGSRFRTG